MPNPNPGRDYVEDDLPGSGWRTHRRERRRQVAFAQNLELIGSAGRRRSGKLYGQKNAGGGEKRSGAASFFHRTKSAFIRAFP